MEYINVDEWLDEVENYATRHERLLEDIYDFDRPVRPWLAEAWRLGAESVGFKKMEYEEFQNMVTSLRNKKEGEETTDDILKSVLCVMEKMLAKFNELESRFTPTEEANELKIRLDVLLKAVGKFALEQGERWRTHEGAEVIDAYEAAQGDNNAQIR